MYGGWGTCASTVVTSGEVITRTQHLLKSHKLSRSSHVVWKKLMLALLFTVPGRWIMEWQWYYNETRIYYIIHVWIDVCWSSNLANAVFELDLVHPGNSHLLVISNDTDTIARLLRFIHRLRERGLQQLWVEFGTGERKRHIPLHVLADKLGVELSRVILKAHILTGDDAISKIGTKHASRSCDPHRYLSDFAESHTYLKRLHRKLRNILSVYGLV